MLIETVSIESWKVASVADVKSSARISHSAEDALTERWIDVATAYLEREYRISILGRRLKMTQDWFGPFIELPKPPLRYADGQPPASAIQSISYRDASGDDQVVDLATIDVTKPDQCFHISPVSAWPVGAACSVPLTVVFDVGYASAENVPIEIWQAVVLLASYYLTHREATIEDPRMTMADRKLDYGIEALMRGFRVQRRMVEIA